MGECETVFSCTYLNKNVTCFWPTTLSCIPGVQPINIKPEAAEAALWIKAINKHLQVKKTHGNNFLCKKKKKKTDIALTLQPILVFSFWIQEKGCKQGKSIEFNGFHCAFPQLKDLSGLWHYRVKDYFMRSLYLNKWTGWLPMTPKKWHIMYDIVWTFITWLTLSHSFIRFGQKHLVRVSKRSLYITHFLYF